MQLVLGVANVVSPTLDTTMLLRISLPIAMALILAPNSSSDARESKADTEADAIECVSADIADVHLAKAGSVDEIRVRTVDGGSLQITVETEESDRIVDIHGETYKALRFAPALQGSEFRISALPSMDESSPGCLSSVELYSAGQLVHSYTP